MYLDEFNFGENGVCDGDIDIIITNMPLPKVQYSTNIVVFRSTDPCDVNVNSQ